MFSTMAHLRLDDVIRMLPNPNEEQWVVPFEHGTLQVGLYAPRGHDDQTPHTRDEVYVVVRGTGAFVNGDRRHTFAPGDVIFVPAHREHRFENMSDDFAAWVFFYGPEGGERA
jgi:mannose-6-phosphate isomerase-like protein (cupin superfamily)